MAAICSAGARAAKGAHMAATSTAGLTFRRSSLIRQLPRALSGCVRSHPPQAPLTRPTRIVASENNGYAASRLMLLTLEVEHGLLPSLRCLMLITLFF